MKRREFLEALGGGIAVLLVDESAVDAQQGGRGGGREMPVEVSAWLHIGPDGVVTAFAGKVEVGQNARTSLTQAVAEELRVSPDSIRMVLGETDVTPWDGGTAGSRTTPTVWPQLRNAAATAREILIDLAAQKWGVDRATVTASNGRLIAGGRSAGFGELASTEALTKTISTTAAAPAAQWKVAGTSLPKVGAREIVTGVHKYPYDMKLPGMLHAKILHPPAFGAALASLDASAAEAMAGVKVVHEDDFVAVAAADPETAAKALAALRAVWKPAPAQPDNAGLAAYLKQNAASAPAGFEARATYQLAYIAHVPLEPRAAVAEWSGDSLTVWTGTQMPFGVRDALAALFKMPAAKVKMAVPDTGSGYGGKHVGDAALEAARISKAVGKPVRRGWTREEEMTWAYFRPAAVIEIAGKANPDGTLAAWEFHNYLSGGAGLQTPYRVAGAREQFHQSKTPLRTGSYRAIGATANNFARECYMDELAHSVGMDPLEFRLKNLPHDERLRSVLQAAAERFGWKDRKKSAGRGFGLAAGFEKGGRVATFVEIAVDRPSGTVKPLRVAQAFECGAVVNPEHLRNQIEGAVIMGIGGALFEEIEFAGGKILNNSLASYRVPRFADAPPIETVLMDRKDLPSAGAGETPIIGIAPAIANAVFDATGQRIRNMPLARNGLKLA